MALTSDEFLSAFHSIKGFTIAERKKNLGQLLNDSINSKIDYSQIKPATALEELLTVDVLIFFKNKDELLQLLYNENLLVIDKILKSKWFIKNAFENISGKELILNIFPKVSYNTKLKLLNRLTLVLNNASKCDEFFHCLRESYGIYLASKLLAGCSKSLILNTLETSRVEVTPKQLLFIIKKIPSITLEIFGKLDTYQTSTNIGEKYKYVFRYLMKTNPSVFIDLYDKYPQSFHFGKRATRTFIVNNKQFFVSHSDKLYKLVKGSEIGRCMPSEFIAIFSELFPKSIENLSENLDDYLSLLNFLPKQDRADLLFSTFKEQYGTELLDYPKFVIPKIFELISPSFRDSWIEAHEKPAEVTEEIWISFMKTDKSIPLIEKKLSHTSNIKDRESLVHALVLTCKINNDFIALTHVCEYVANKLRNDHINVRRRYLETLRECFPLQKLNEEQWNHVNTIVQRCILNSDRTYFCVYFVENFIHFSLANDLPIIEQLKVWKKITYGEYNIVQSKPEFEKKCLASFYEILPLTLANEELEEQYIRFLNSICDWNKRHPTEKISLFTYEDAMSALLKRLEERKGFPADQVAMNCIYYEYKKAREVDMLKLLIHQSCIYSINLRWLIQNHPVDVLPIIELLMQKFFKAYLPMKTLQNAFQSIVYEDLKNKISTICNEERCKETESQDQKRFAIFILSFVLKNEEFIKIAEEFYPEDSEANVENIESQTDYKLQQALLPCFRYFIRPYVALEPILHFCKGDYMQFAQKSLYSITQNVAENRLVDFLNKLGDRAVSVRKHSIYLCLKLLNNTTTLNILKTFMKNEKNPSIRKTLLKSVFNYFLRNPDDFTWGLVKENVTEIHTDDIEAFQALVIKSNKVPVQFFETYIVFVWEFLDKLPLNERVLQGKCQILDAIIEERVKLLAEDFCMGLIRAHLFKSSITKFEEKMYTFTGRYVLHAKQDNITEIFNIINNNYRITPKNVYKFIEELSTCFMNGKNANKHVFTDFVSLWTNTIKPYEALEEFLYLHLTLIFANYKEKKQSMAECGKEIAKLFIMLINEKSADLQLFKRIFENTFKDRFLADLKGSKEENYMILIDNIIKFDETNDACLSLGLSLLPKKITSMPKIKIIYDSIFKTATKNLKPNVQIQLHTHVINKD